MIKIMAQENMKEWESDAAVIHETVRAVVEAYGKGLIKLRPPTNMTDPARLRYAPSFIPGQSPTVREGFAYTGQTVGEFLGWLRGQKEKIADDRVHVSLTALQFVEEGLLKAITSPLSRRLSIAGFTISQYLQSIRSFGISLTRYSGPGQLALSLLLGLSPVTNPPQYVIPPITK